MASKFLKPMDKPTAKPISVRLPIEVHTRFEKLKERAENNGYTVSITDIVTDAIRNACDYIEEDLNKLYEDELAVAKAQDDELRSMNMRATKSVKA